MRKILLILPIVLIVVFILLGLPLFKKSIGDVRPAILPPKSTNILQTNITPVQLPLIIPSGYALGVFAQNLEGVRDLEFSPGGTLLASLTSRGEVVALPNKNQAGKADDIKVILRNLKNPHGLAFHDGKLYVAEETKLTRYSWDELHLVVSLDRVLFSIPAGGRHFTRSIIFDSRGRLYLSIGSTCDVCNEKNPWHAAIITSDAEGNTTQVFAKGLRNSVFVTINPSTNEVWATEMGRDFLGDDAPPDEINIIRSGKNYGWPDCFGDKTPDVHFDVRASSTTCSTTEAPIYRIPAHSAPLGLAFIHSAQFPSDWQGDLLVAYHGSWNRSVPVGYKVVHMKVKGNEILWEEDFLSGFLQGSQTIGRPVDLIFDKNGNLYISDDKAGLIYILGKK